LLARSATGQKLTVYTQLIRRPLPGQSRHLIILDNGRSALRVSPLAEALLCIRCGACLNACPVFREIGGHAYDSVYPGPIGSVLSASFFGPDFVPLAQASSLCGACKQACPVDIDLPKLLTRVRAQMSPGNAGTPGRTSPALRLKPSAYPLTKSTRLFLQLYGRVARSPSLFAAAQRLASLGMRVISPFSNWFRLPAFTGWGYSKDLPRFAAKSFRLTVMQSGDGWPGADASQPAGTRSTDTSEQLAEQDALKPALPLPTTGLVDQFAQELTGVSGNIVLTTGSDIAANVAKLALARGVNRIYVEPGLLKEDVFAETRIALSHEPDPSITLGVTGSLCGLADTGSIIITEASPHRQPGSLLPEIHVAVLRAADVLPTLADALRLPGLRESDSAVIITGPSRTGDIEMTHTIGVHGPRELYVLLVE
jgi:L-lactate utilization protein LutB